MLILGDLSEDVKLLRKTQVQGGITFSGKNVAEAVMAVKSKGTILLA
jgi:hypothetical protein